MTFRPGDEIADLIKRVEAATGLDIELDYLILRHLAGGKDKNFIYWPVTTSVDAVIGLIGEKMPGANWQLEFMSGRHLSVLYPDAASGSFSGDGAGTPALSLLLAFLRAWEQRGDG